MGYANTKQTIRVNVDDDDKKKMEELGGLSDSPLDANAKQSIGMSEPPRGKNIGLYGLGQTGSLSVAVLAQLRQAPLFG